MPGQVRIVIEIDDGAPAFLQALSAALASSGTTQPGAVPGDLGDRDAGAAPTAAPAGDQPHGTLTDTPYATAADIPMDAGPAPSGASASTGEPPVFEVGAAGVTVAEHAGISAGAAPGLPDE